MLKIKTLDYNNLYVYTLQKLDLYTCTMIKYIIYLIIELK